MCKRPTCQLPWCFCSGGTEVTHSNSLLTCAHQPCGSTTTSRSRLCRAVSAPRLRGIFFLWAHSVPLVKAHSHCKPQKSGACHKHLEYSYVTGSMTSSWVMSWRWFGLSESSVLNCVRPVLTIEKCHRSLSSVSESVQLCHVLRPYSLGSPLLQSLCYTCSHTAPGLSFVNKRGVVSAR